MILILDGQMNKKIYIIFAILIFGITGCGQNQIELKETIDLLNGMSSIIQKETDQLLPSQNTMDDVAECIDPIADFMYYVRDKESKIPGVNYVYLPQKPWSEISLSQIPVIKEDEYIVKQDIAGFRVYNGKEEIWIKNIIANSSNSNIIRYIVYFPKTEQWQEVSGMVGKNIDLAASLLFIAEDGSIWAQNKWLNGQKNTFLADTLPILSKYNEKTNTFDFINNREGVLGSTLFNYVQNDTIILLDKSEYIWMFIRNDGVYKYDITKKEIKKISDLDNSTITSATLTKNNEIYFILMSYASSQWPSWNIFKIDLEKEKVRTLDLTNSVLTNSFQNPSNVYSDNNDRLWIGGLGWLESDRITWIRLHPSPTFITNASESTQTYWQNPQIILQSSDGKHWFNSDNGITSLDLQNKKWCWVTTYRSNLIEDNEQNLWMIADGKLYRRPVEQ